MKYILFLSLLIGMGCTSHKDIKDAGGIGSGITVTKEPYNLELIIKPILDSLQRDNIKMDNIGKKHWTKDQLCTYATNLYISQTLGTIMIKYINEAYR